MYSITLISDSTLRTQEIGLQLGKQAQEGDIFCLYGDLAAGKTVFTRGFTAAFSSKNEVSSPSFAIIQEYDTRPVIYHIDLYRLNSVQEVLDISLDEYLYSNGICLIEWPDLIEDTLSPSVISIHFHILSPYSRKIKISMQEPRSISIAQ